MTCENCNGETCEGCGVCECGACICADGMSGVAFCHPCNSRRAFDAEGCVVCAMPLGTCLHPCRACAFAEMLGVKL